MEVKTPTRDDAEAPEQYVSSLGGELALAGRPAASRPSAKLQRRNRNQASISMLIVSFSLKLMSLIATVLLGLYVYNYALESDSFNVSRIDFSGNKNLDVAALRQAIRSELPENILRIDMRRLQARIEAEPWVLRACVRRVLPNSLHIKVEERAPAAVAEMQGQLYLIDREGVILTKYDARYGRFDMPILKGLLPADRENHREENRKRAELFFRLVADLDSTGMGHSKRISEIDVTNPRDAVLVPTDDAVEIHIGDRDFLRRYQMFLANSATYEGLKRQYGNIEAIDLRFDNQIICRTSKNVTNLPWRTDSGRSTAN